MQKRLDMLMADLHCLRTTETTLKSFEEVMRDGFEIRLDRVTRAVQVCYNTWQEPFTMHRPGRCLCFRFSDSLSLMFLLFGDRLCVAVLCIVGYSIIIHSLGLSSGRGV